MKIDSIMVGPIMTNCYLLSDETAGVCARQCLFGYGLWNFRCCPNILPYWENDGFFMED